MAGLPPGVTGEEAGAIFHFHFSFSFFFLHFFHFHCDGEGSGKLEPVMTL